MAYPLLTNRLSIEPLSLVDLDAFLSYRRDPEIARFQSWDPTYSKEQAIELIESQVGVFIPESGNWLQLGVHERMSGELLGDLALHSVPNSNATFEIGFTMARKHQGQGYAKEAALRLIELLFAEMGALKITASCDSRNIASIKLLSALGFENISSEGWTEQFKGELVTVLFFSKSQGIR